jgi:plasmid stabilization system protein ParE
VEFKIFFSPQAISDLKVVETYLSKQGANDPAGFRRRLSQRPLEPATFPSRGRRVHRDPDLRYLIEGKHLIIYPILASRPAVKVLRFWHAARDPRRLRLK